MKSTLQEKDRIPMCTTVCSPNNLSLEKDEK